MSPIQAHLVCAYGHVDISVHGMFSIFTYLLPLTTAKKTIVQISLCTKTACQLALKNMLKKPNVRNKHQPTFKSRKALTVFHLFLSKHTKRTLLVLSHTMATTLILQYTSCFKKCPTLSFAATLLSTHQ